MGKKGFFLIILIFFTSCSFQLLGQNDSDSLRANLKDLTPAERVEVLNRLSDTFKDDSIELSLEYLLLAYKAAVKQDDINIIIDQSEKVADLYTQLGQYDAALNYYNISLNNADKISANEKLPRIYRLIGNVYYYLGEYDKCLESHLESLRYAEMVKDEEGIAGAYNNIGLINMKSEKYDEALENYIKAEKMFAKTGSLLNQGRAIINIGNIYYFKKEFDNALGFYQRALNIFEKTNEPAEVALAAQNISVLYDDMGDSENAVHYGEMALNLYIKSNNVWGIASLSKNLGYHYLKKKNYIKAQEYLDLSLINSQKTNSLPLLFGTYKALTDLYEGMGDFQNAFKYLKLEYSVSDSISSMETTEKLANLESKYTLEKKEKENELLRKYFIYISILSILVVLILLFNYRLKVRTNRQLMEKNAEIEEKNALLEEINSTKNKFFSIIAHDLKNPLAAFIGFIDVIQQRLNEMPREELQENLKQVSLLADSMLDLLENLLKWGRSQAGVLEFKPTPISVKSMVDNALKIVSMNAQAKNIQIETKIDDDLTVFADWNMMSTVTRNLISNAIKFTPRGGKVSIEALETGNTLRLVVTDSGVGISQEDIVKLFRIDLKFRRKGTEQEPGTGLGLIICQEFIEKNGGSIFVKSTPNVGSEFGFTLPLNK